VNDDETKRSPFAVVISRETIEEFGRLHSEIERLRELIRKIKTDVDGSMRDLWTAVREPDKSSMSVDHALNHLAQSLAPLRREAL
jgi:hypothetical protein